MKWATAKIKNVPTKVLIEWKVTSGKDLARKLVFDLKMSTTTKLFWQRAMAKENQVIFNYIINAEGI